MNGKRVFVTGGAGVIGLELLPRLVASGAQVLVGDLKPRPCEFSKSVRYRQGDLNDMSSGELRAFAPEIIVHLAATFERSIESAEFWCENFRHNVMLSHHLMTIARDCSSLQRVVFASSYLIYDQHLYQFDVAQTSPRRLAEHDPIRPRNMTGMAKLSHEMELSFLSGFECYPFSTLAVRIYRGYGRNSRDVISRWVRALLDGQPITVYRPQGMFDYIYAADSAEGLFRLAMTADVSGVVNLGTGRSRRVADVVSILQNCFPSAVIRMEDSDIPFEASEADIALLRQHLNWAPEYDLERAIPEIIAHERAKRAAQVPAVEVQYGHNVLITSASRKIPLLRAMQQALRRIDPTAHVVAGDIDAEAPARLVADDFWKMPRLNDVPLNALIDALRARAIGMVLPTRDGELAFWAEAKPTLAAAGIHVIVSPPEGVARCLDKLAFSEWGVAHGLPIIPAATDPDVFGSVPLVVKERFGAGGRGLGLNLAPDMARAHSTSLEAPIFQPFVAGPEISIDAFLTHSGIVHGLVLRRRDRVVSGESQITTTFRDPVIEGEAASVLSALGLSGPVVMQAIVTSDGLRVIEVNARFGGASSASLAVGLDSLFWALLERDDPTATLPPFERHEGNIRQVRVPQDIFLDDIDL